ncbi:patatin-like phospholipase domain-containing protein 4 isoform X1 [Amia ocellicauda]|uniref:patatin-like phospholipase domain-containing protein 4 isoform X1 n=1 Tax=Amia ocellicauda TaxID=2972642 RepID=UPI003464DF27
MSMALLNLSFAACGFLGIYHLGVATALQRHAGKLLTAAQAFAGASGGALVAAVLATVPDKLEHCKEFTYRFAHDVRKQKLGAATPGYDFMSKLREGIEQILPPDAHEVAGDRLHVSITHRETGANRLVSSFASREDLVKVLLASSFVPVYAGMNAVEYKGEKWIDGGLTDSLPVLPVGRTITVSPFSGRLDICPQHDGLLNLRIRVMKQEIMLSADNLTRLGQALFPPEPARLETLCQQGHDDAVRFLKKENWLC